MPGEPRVGRECAWFSTALLLGFVVWRVAPVASSALVRPLEIDEIYTYTVIAEGPANILQRATSGIDGHPPLPYFLTWLARAALGWALPDATGIRALSLLAGGAVAVLCFGVLRARLDRSSAMIGALAILSHPEFLHCTVYARPYALYVLFALVATTASAAYLSSPTPARLVGATLAALLTASVHHLGGLFIVLLAGAGLLVDRRRGAVLTMLMGAATALGTGLCAVIAYQQSKSWETPSWLEPLNAGQAIDMVGDLLPIGWILAPLAVITVARTRGTRLLQPDPVAVVRWLPAAGLPLVVLVVSALLYPVQQAKYALPFVLAPAFVLAGVAATISSAFRAAVLACFGVSLVGTLIVQGREGDREMGQRRETVDIVEHTTAPVLSDVFFMSIKLCFDAPALCPRVGVLHYERALHQQLLRPFAFSADTARSFAAAVGFPRLVLYDRASLPPTFTLLSLGPPTQPALQYVLYPDHEAEPLIEGVYRMTTRAQHE